MTSGKKVTILIALLGMMFCSVSIFAKQKISGEANKNLRIANIKYKSEKNYDAALEYYQKVLAEHPDNIESLKNCGDINVLRGNEYQTEPDKMMEFISKANQFYLAYIESASKIDELSKDEIKELTATKKLQIKLMEKLFNYSKMKFNSEDFATAEKILLEIEQMPTDSLEFKSSVFEALSYVYIAIDRKEDATKYLLKMLENNPADMVALQNLATEALDNKRYEEAIEWLTKLTELEPNNNVTIYNLAVAFSNAGNKTKAYEYYMKAVEINPNDKDALLGAAGITYEDKNMSSTIDIYKKIVAITPVDITDLHNLSVFLNQEKRFAEVVTYGEQFFAAANDDTEKKLAATLVKYAAEQLNNKAVADKYKKILETLK